jgi:peptidoglycan pentaglycine glycine transferase (the first glycine)
MIVKTIEEKEIWENFLQKVSKKTFLESWNWGEFQKKQGRKIWRLGIYEDEELKGVTLLVKTPLLKLGVFEKNFFFCPHGPVILDKNLKARKDLLAVLLEKMRVLAKEEKAVFIRLTPLWESTEEIKKLFQSFGFRKAPMFIHPEITWQLSLLPSEEKILQDMRKTTRYLIRKGLSQSSLKITQGKSSEDLDGFWKLYKETVDRHRFSPFSKEYLTQEISAFQKDNQIMVFSAWLKDQLLASAIIVFWQGIAFYHHGASSYKDPKVPAAYLLQWKVIQEAKRRNCHLYNFWGIASTESPSHPWQGLTLFKRGFGGKEEAYLATQDLILSPFYWLNWILEKRRRAKRGV